MHQEIAQKWTAALRSGEYKQTKHQLKTCDNRFCCLGVLCNLYQKENGGEWTGYGYFLGCGQILPPEVVDWAGMKSRRGDLHPLSLSDYNDKGKDFYEIAQIIENNIENL